MKVWATLFAVVVAGYVFGQINTYAMLPYFACFAHDHQTEIFFVCIEVYTGDIVRSNVIKNKEEAWEYLFYRRRSE